ncbi:MAG TPA: hypothetical protein VJR05_12805 [Acidimicrobiia bacterium]|nr:hypothetical protein [Acidimicrobiia bacterium]
MGWRRVALGICVWLVAACTPEATTPISDPPPAGPVVTTSQASGTVSNESGGPSSVDTTAATASGSSSNCPPPAGKEWEVSATSDLRRIHEREDGLTVDLAEYPLPPYEGKPWSQWGQGAYVEGRFFSAVGDHFGVDGNSFFYVLEEGVLARISDVLSHTTHQPGEFGYGKVHAQMVAGSCGEVYAHTYWGTRRGLEYGDGYQGDLLFSLVPGTVEMLGVTAPERGTASMAGSPDGRLLFLEAVTVENDTQLVVYDTWERRVIDAVIDPLHTGRRALAVAADGRVLYSSGEGDLTAYDPLQGTVAETGVALPGRMLRAVTTPTPGGDLIGVTTDPDEFFVLEASGELRRLGPAPAYTASLALAPGGERVYFIPGAHGSAWEMGTPLMALDPVNGEQTIVVELAEMVAEATGLRAGGTYNLVMDPDGSRIFIGINAGEGEESFGRVLLVVVGLPR